MSCVLRILFLVCCFPVFTNRKMLAGAVYALFITLQILEIVLGGSTKKSPPSEHTPIKYPGPIQDIGNRYGIDNATLEEPAECKGKRYCDIKPPGYPQERFNDFLKGVKKIPRPAVIVEESPEDLNRVGETLGEDGCETIISYKAPYQVRDTSNNLRFVVQAPEHDFVQKVRLEECAKPRSPCFQVFAPEPGIEVFCEQKDVTWELMVALGSGYETARIPLPMCCSCKYRRL